MATSASAEGVDLGLAQVSFPVATKLDVIFVHGLNGSRSLTWTNSNDEFWPSWIADSLSNARVWTYGYNSTVWKSPSQDAIELHTTRLLKQCVQNNIGKSSDSTWAPKVIFVCHSLGGILVKSAVTQIFTGSQESSWTYLRDQIASIVFIGTPHRGSEWANRLYTLYLGPGSRFVQLLRKGDSALLSLVAERFNNIWGQRPILTFREQKGVLPLGLIVKPQDARTNCLGEVCYDEPYNHRRIAKVKSRNENLYRTLLKHLLDLTADAATLDREGTVTHRAPPATEASTATSENTLEPEYIPWRKIHSRAFYHHFLLDKTIREREWEILDEEFRPDVLPTDTDQQLKTKFKSGTYSFYYPGHESTMVILTVPSRLREMEAQWTIISPNSAYHPGRHSGHLDITNDFPFKSPRVIWDSAILSPYVASNGRTCTKYEYDHWSPKESSFYNILHSLASIVIYGPELEVAEDPYVPKLRPEIVRGELYSLKPASANDPKLQWISRVTNLFSRAYNRFDDDEYDAEDTLASFSTASRSDQSVISLDQLSDHQREISLLAVNDALSHLVGSAGWYPAVVRKRLADTDGLTDPEADFRGAKTLKELLIRERQWVDGINRELNDIAGTRR